MKRLFLVIVVAMIAIVPAQRLAACGDKFMVPSRGLTFLQAYKPAHPSSILLYVPAATPADVIGSAKVQALLTLVGHRVGIARNPQQFAQMLTAKVDIVLTDLAQAAAIAGDVRAAPSRPTIVPVMNKVTKAEEKTCRAQYLCQLKDSDQPEKFIATIDTAMKQRAKDVATQGAPSGH